MEFLAYRVAAFIAAPTELAWASSLLGRACPARLDRHRRRTPDFLCPRRRSDNNDESF